jgi:hypothetical protein
VFGTVSVSGFGSGSGSLSGSELGLGLDMGLGLGSSSGWVLTESVFGVKVWVSGSGSVFVSGFKVW